jgi:hypothetical protein
MKDQMFYKFQEIILYQLLNDTISAQLKTHEFKNMFINNEKFQWYSNDLENFDRTKYTRGY